MPHVLDMQDKEDGKLTKNEDSDDSSIEEVKTIAKEKKPRSEKQIEAFKKTQENRKKNIELKKDAKKLDAAKLLMQEKPIEKKPKKVVKKEIVDSDSSSEEEVIIIERKKKPKKKITKRIIVEESSSEEEEEVKPIEKTFKSQQNKRSININAVKPISPTTCYFI
jgi:hypothetical protein